MSFSALSACRDDACSATTFAFIRTKLDDLYMSNERPLPASSSWCAARLRQQAIRHETLGVPNGDCDHLVFSQAIQDMVLYTHGKRASLNRSGGLMVLYSPPGSGKSTTVLALARGDMHSLPHRSLIVSPKQTGSGLNNKLKISSWLARVYALLGVPQKMAMTDVVKVIDAAMMGDPGNADVFHSCKKELLTAVAGPVQIAGYSKERYYRGPRHGFRNKPVLVLEDLDTLDSSTKDFLSILAKNAYNAQYSVIVTTANKESANVVCSLHGTATIFAAREVLRCDHEPGVDPSWTGFQWNIGTAREAVVLRFPHSEECVIEAALARFQLHGQIQMCFDDIGKNQT